MDRDEDFDLLRRNANEKCTYIKQSINTQQIDIIIMGKHVE